MRKASLLYCLLAASWASQASAQQVNLSWRPDAADPVGRQLATAVRERLARSSLFSLVYGEDQTAIRANFNTLREGTYSGSGNHTIYALVVLFHFRGETFHRYVTQYVGTCGAERVEACAADIVARLDETAEQVRQAAAR